MDTSHSWLFGDARTLSVVLAIVTGLFVAGGDLAAWIGSLTLARTVAPDPVGRVLIAHHKPTSQSGMEHVRERQALASAGSSKTSVATGSTWSWPATSMPPPTSPATPSPRTTRSSATCGGHAPADASTTSWSAAVTRAPPLDIAACDVVLDTPTDGVWARSTGIRTSSRRPREFGIPAAADAPASTGVTVDDAWPADRPDVGPDAPESRSSHRSVQSTHRTPVASTYAVVARPSVG